MPTLNEEVSAPLYYADRAYVFSRPVTGPNGTTMGFRVLECMEESNAPIVAAALNFVDKVAAIAARGKIDADEIVELLNEGSDISKGDVS